MESNKNFYEKVLCMPGKYKLVWSLGSKKSIWTKDIDELIKIAAREGKDVFYGVGMADKSYGSRRRTTNETVTGISALWLDIDIKTDNPKIHAKPNLPATLEEAIEIARRFLEPSIIVFSGHGIQAFYLTTDPVDLTDKDTKRYFASLLQQFQRKHREAFPQYELDYTHDLARILRCPGTINNKDPENPIECKIIHETDVDYWPSEIEDAIDFNAEQTYEAELPMGDNAKTKQTPEQILNLKSTADFVKWFDNEGLVLNTDASLDIETWTDLEQMSNGKLAKVYNHEADETDFSSIDMALASLAVKNCLSDQHVVDLLVMHRRKYQINMQKITRKDYYARTLIKASSDKFLDAIRRKPPSTVAPVRPLKNPGANDPDRSDQSSNDTDPANNTALDQALKKKRTSFSGYSPTEKNVIRRHLAGLLNIDIVRLVCYPKDPEPSFEIELGDLPGRSIILGPYRTGVMNQFTFRSKIAAVGVMPNKVSKEIWDPKVLNDLRILTEEGDVPLTSTYEGQIDVWLRQYLSIDNDMSSENDYDGSSDKTPYRSNCGQYVYFDYDKFRNWLRVTKCQSSEFNFENSMHHYGFTGKGCLLRTPAGFFPETKKASDEKDKGDD